MIEAEKELERLPSIEAAHQLGKLTQDPILV
jgi:hypothetical protein